LLLGAGMLAACSGGNEALEVPAQTWQDLEVRVESRPSPPRAGANEFLVIVSEKRGRPAHNLMVSLRTSDRDNWKQAIQDGQVGVYRRAIEAEPGERSTLQVQLKGRGAEGVLRFPLQVAP
jgi:hypothetical protein